MKRGPKRFKVVEYSSYYAVIDLWTGKERAIGDGVDTLFTQTGKVIRPGTERFRRLLQRHMNQTADETFEAYFS